MLTWSILALILAPAVCLNFEEPAGALGTPGHFLKHILRWRTLDGERPFIERLPKSNTSALPPRTFAPRTEPVAPDARPELHSNMVACALFLTSACEDWWSQTPESVKLYIKGSKECPNNCNGKGTCNYDIGVCQCTVGFGGVDCSTPVRRPCSYRTPQYSDPEGELIGEGNLTTPGFTASRCAGVCDETMGLCYCGYESKYGRIPAPAGSPWGSPPVKPGIPLVTPCQPSTGPQGERLWGSMPWVMLYGASGFCNFPNKPQHCPCVLENLHGAECQIVSEAWCPNQCNLRGECILGFCKCDEGWYGTACDKMKQGATYTPALESRKASQSQAWLESLKGVWKEPLQSKQLTDPPANRKRPLIYVYDLPPEFNVGIVQIKHHREMCNWRRFTAVNTTEIGYNGYMVENYFHETLLSSPHRTLDPEEADFFYVPVYYGCYAWPVLGWADGPWFGPAKVTERPYQAMWMFLKAKRWLEQAYPYWNRSKGADHIFMPTHDEGACYMAREVYDNAIMFTHWGRTDLDHESGTAYWPDNYSAPLNPGWAKRDSVPDWRDMWRGHRCYTPGKDLVIPALKTSRDYPHSPLLGAPPLEKDILFYFRGDCGHSRYWWYSRGIRQTLFRLAYEDDWWVKYRIMITDRNEESYSESLARSKFCLVAPGDGWSARVEDAIVHGCIPVVIQDEIEMVFHDILDWNQFGVRIAQQDTKRLPQILLAFTDRDVEEKQKALSKVWHRFFYATGPWHRGHLQDVYRQARKRFDPSLWSRHTFAPYTRYPFRNDAFHTIMQWLYARIPTLSQRYKREHGANRAEPARQ